MSCIHVGFHFVVSILFFVGFYALFILNKRDSACTFICFYSYKIVNRKWGHP